MNETKHTQNELPGPEVIGEWLERYPWFTAARMLRRSLTGRPDPHLSLTDNDRGLLPGPLEVDAEALLHLSADDIIDRFLQEKELRIVAREGEPEPSEEIVTEAELSEEEDLVTEELAEVYLHQGLKREALAIYRRLSLLNPEKSVYFAEIIEKLETNN